ncbi:MAG: family 20 glycosylhydrolase [Armatimonadota bacterium]|nr:family 20 glycosylhydrolase [bacterium]
MSSTNLYLAPYPKKISLKDGVLNTSGKSYIQLVSEAPQCIMGAARQTGLDWQITASPKAPKEQVGLVIKLDEFGTVPAEGYKLNIKPERIEIISSTPAGAFYGACTLKQIVRQFENEIPCLAISDWPDLSDRGVMLDISRDKVPTMQTLYRFVDLLAEWKINQFQLYTEHTFAYLAHPKVWEHADPMTAEQIMDLDAYCRDRFIELVPNQNSFGHMDRWLKLEEYNTMAELPNGGETSWGYRPEPFSISPADKRSVPFVAGLYDELLPHFTSSLFNVGCDETMDLGYGRSKSLCEKRGTGRVYLDFLIEIHKLVTKHDRTMMFWGDIIMHHPELIHELPNDIIALEWGYEANHPFAEHSAMFGESGVPFYVCPGTSSWNSLSGRTENAIGNIASAAKNAVKREAIGMLNTAWGDHGHWDPLPVCYLGFLAGAMASWNAKPDLHKNMAESLSLHAFGDPTFKIGKAFYDLGNVYQAFSKKTANCSIPWQALFTKGDPDKVLDEIEISEFDEMERRLDEIEAALKGEQMVCPDAGIVRHEIGFVFDLMRLSAKVGKMRLGGAKVADSEVDSIKKAHRKTWLLRNRPGGLEDSVNWMIV